MSHHAEPPIIDYARFYGLVEDHLQLDPLQALASPENLGSPRSFLDDPPELFHIDLDNAKVPQERLEVDADAASFLSIVESLKHSRSHSDEDLGIDRRRVRRMKHELPLLRSDHDIDVLRFAAPIVPDLENEFLPLETVDVEEDEGLEWPSSYYALPDEFDKKSRSETIEASKDDLLYLQETLKFNLEGVEHGAFEVDDLPYKRVSPLQVPTQDKLTLDRELLQNNYHLHYYLCRPARNLMYPRPTPAVLISCLILRPRPERKHVQLSE